MVMPTRFKVAKYDLTTRCTLIFMRNHEMRHAPVGLLSSDLQLYCHHLWQRFAFPRCCYLHQCGGNVNTFVCRAVCLSVREQDYA